MRLTRFLMLIILAASQQPAFSEITVHSSMNWSTGRFELLASKALENGMSPSDHPLALKSLERELPPYVIKELGNLAWNRHGTLQELMEKDPSLKIYIESIAGSINLEWSRISEDRKSVEAFYSLNLEKVLKETIPPSALENLAEKPIAWVPVPEDDWSGILIYVPDKLPLRGTGLFANPRPALFARILSNNLEVLLDPAMENGATLTYQRMDDEEERDSIIGRRPYQVMARELYGEYPCDIILSREDTRRILAADSGRRALSENRIIILLDAESDEPRS